LVWLGVGGSRAGRAPGGDATAHSIGLVKMGCKIQIHNSP
jgi:hypothetical protein